MSTPQDPLDVPHPFPGPPFPLPDSDAPPNPDEDEPAPVPLPSEAVGYNIKFARTPEPEKHLAGFVQWLLKIDANDGRLRQIRPSMAKLAPKDWGLGAAWRSPGPGEGVREL
jgi:hypothetical protein